MCIFALDVKCKVAHYRLHQQGGPYASSHPSSHTPARVITGSCINPRSRLSASPIDGAANADDVKTIDGSTQNGASSQARVRHGSHSSTSNISVCDRNFERSSAGSLPLLGSSEPNPGIIAARYATGTIATRAAAHIALYRTRMMLAEVWRDRFDTRHYPAFRAYALARVRLARAAIA